MKKNAAGLFKCNKPLLVITHGEDLSKQERALLSKAKFLFKTKDNTYLQLDISAFKDSVNEAKEHFRMTRSKFFQHDEYLSTDSCNNVVVKRFENEFKDYAVFGKGAHYSEKDPTYFYFDTLPGAKDSVPYEISYWVYTDSRRAAYPAVYITQLDPGGKEINKFDTNAKFATNIFNNWVRVSMSFTLTNKANKILILGEGNYATFDEIMIRPLNVEVVTQFDNDSTFIFNNYPIR